MGGGIGLAKFPDHLLVCNRLRRCVLVVSRSGVDPCVYVCVVSLSVAGKPVVLEKSRYEYYLSPATDLQLWFREMFWVCLLSRGHSTYGGIKCVRFCTTLQPFARETGLWHSNMR